MANEFRVLIADDDALARESARELLASEPGVEVAGECAAAAEVLPAVRAAAPDLVLLSVEIPGLDVFGALREIAEEGVASVIAAARDRHALAAVEDEVFETLGKPFDAPRFLEALGRARARLRYATPGALERRLLSLLEELKPAPRPADRLVVKSGGRVSFLRAEEIDWIEAEGNYVRIHAGNQTPLARETMGEIEARLDPRRFFRIHKSTIVNADRIREIQPLFNGAHSVLLQDGTRLTWSRGYREQLRALTGEEL